MTEFTFTDNSDSIYGDDPQELKDLSGLVQRDMLRYVRTLDAEEEVHEQGR